MSSVSHISISSGSDDESTGSSTSYIILSDSKAEGVASPTTVLDFTPEDPQEADPEESSEEDPSEEDSTVEDLMEDDEPLQVEFQKGFPWQVLQSCAIVSNRALKSRHSHGIE
ncbi:hypothetical protein Tco_1069484 [Tanacetum coccineum]|uniref:Uncharacterized protein n=1 Tax=Tanacetum coccineum TaxID=301880 RepID=A0ABQ5HIN1_9ASTR